ncbi:MAG: phosphatidylglycerol lysyltransferase [Treponema sp.]|jgi:phosphoglucomutase|nr:phosphatidylglycerol lysyltransferase [Treponema sp.]
MVLKEDVDAALGKMILSASGWRGVFASDGNEESAAEWISPAHRIIAAAAALVFAEYLRAINTISGKPPLALLGCDTRPTGKAIAETMIPVLLAQGCTVRYAGITAAPEIMAWARSLRVADKGSPEAGFVYISASHNPIGHNGLKFGLTDGGVLAAKETAKLIASFRSLLADANSIASLETLIAGSDLAAVQEVYAAETKTKNEARKAYFDFSEKVAWGEKIAANAGAAPVSVTFDIATALKQGLASRPLGLACDFNGSARTVSIDRDFFTGMGIKFEAINAQPGEIAHRIVPEGESLEPCRALLEELHRRDPSFMLGYVPDCDGDRGNLVVWDETLAKARALEAQEVFALACVAELSHLVWGSGSVPHIAIAVNDPTSLRIDRIAAAFGAEVFRAEVGEANVVGLARRLREKGYIVRILGEGSAGGNITHPSAVRDPLHTVLALAKLLSLRGGAGRPGLFEIWCERSNQRRLYRDDFNLADVIASLPAFVTTGAYAEEAVLRVNTSDHSLLKDRYQRIFLREWEAQKEKFKTRYGIHSWEAIAYNGMEEKRGLANFGEAGRGGLKINFLNNEGMAIASIWMRGSATEPVFRVMAEVEGTDKSIEHDLIDWQRRMTLEADKAG